MPSDAELLATERLKNSIKLTGDYHDDALKSLQAMLLRELKNDTRFGMKALAVYDNDTENIPSYPAICLVYKGARGPNQRTIGKESATFDLDVLVDVWYYHADVSSKNSSSEIRKALSSISSIIQRNSDLNGYCRMGAKIGSSTVRDRPVGNSIIAGGVIDVTIKIIYRDRAAGPG